MQQVKLLGFWSSPFARRVIWALKHKGVAYEYVEEDLLNKSEALLKYNPVHKKVPVLVHGGKPIAESSVILEYIEETWPQNPLLPKDPYEKAQARLWIKFSDDQIKTFVLTLKTAGEEQEKAVNEAKEVLKIIEGQGLGDKKFFSGEAFGMVDIAFGWVAVWLQVLEEVGGVQVLEPDSFPRLQAWIDNFNEVPAIKENLPDRNNMKAIYTFLRERNLSSATQ